MILPDEILTCIGEYLENKELVKFLRVNKRFHKLGQNILDKRNIKDVEEKRRFEIKWIYGERYNYKLALINAYIETFDLSFRYLTIDDIDIVELKLPDLSVKSSYVKIELDNIPLNEYHKVYSYLRSRGFRISRKSHLIP